MPFKEIEQIIKIFFPKTKYYETGKGFFKNVYVIHSRKRKLVLKISRNKKHIRKDFTTYRRLPTDKRNKFFAKIYWVDDLFMLQKYGEKAKVPKEVINKLKNIGKIHGLKDIREANIMKFDNKFKIVDAERK